MPQHRARPPASPPSVCGVMMPGPQVTNSLWDYTNVVMNFLVGNHQGDLTTVRITHTYTHPDRHLYQSARLLPFGPDEASWSPSIIEPSSPLMLAPHEAWAWLGGPPPGLTRLTTWGGLPTALGRSHHSPPSCSLSSACGGSHSSPSCSLPRCLWCWYGV